MISYRRVILDELCDNRGFLAADALLKSVLPEGIHPKKQKGVKAMKKLRLISFMLAFVMVVAMMVPALAILVAADGETLPGGDTIKAWNIGFPDGKKADTALDKAVTTTIDNVQKDAAWAGAAYQLQALKGGKDSTAVHANFIASYNYAFKNGIDAANFYGVMFDFANTNGTANNAFLVSLVVDGQAYYAIGNFSTAEEFAVETGALSYFKGADGEWTTVSNVNATFSGKEVPSMERATRYPGGTVGSWFVPVDSFYKTYGEGGIEAYNSGAAQNPEALSIETLAAASEITLVIGVVWNAANVVDVTAANAVYSTDWVAPMALPETLPSLDTPEHTNHNAYAGYVKDKFPSGAPVDAAIAGKDYTVSDNMLTETIAIAENTGNAAGNQTVEAPILANKNVAGVLLRMRGLKGDTSNGNGISVGFRANGNLYIANTQFDITDGKLAKGNTANYLYDEALGGWVFYRDAGKAGENGSHTTLRILGNMNGYAFIPIENFNLATDQESTKSYRQNTTYGTNKNVVADLETAGISEVLIGGVWNATVAVDEFYYVYVDGYSMTEAPDKLPGDVVNAYNTGWPANGINTWVQSAGYINNALTNFKDVMFDEADLGAGEAVADSKSVNGKFEHATKYSVEGLAAKNTLGFSVELATTGVDANNGVIFALLVDGVAYYAVSFGENGSTNFILEDGTSKWIAVNNKQYAFSGILAENENLYQRAIRLPAQFSGKFYAPVESFFTAYGEAGLAAYNGTKAEAETQLTEAILAEAESIELYAIATWGADFITFGNAAIVEKGPYTELAPEGDKPTALPTVENIIHRADYNGNFWTEGLVADNAVTPIDGIWGAEFVTSGIAVEDVTAAKWADLGGVLLTVNNADKAAATFTMNFKHTQKIAGTDADGNPTEEIKERTYDFSTAKGYGAKPIYLWQGGNLWAVEGAGETFTIPAGYVGYVYIPVTALTGTIHNENSGYPIYDINPACYTTLFSDFVADLAEGGSLTFTGAALAGVEATAEFVWIDGLGELINNGEAEKPTNFPVLNETAIVGHGCVYNFLTNITPENATEAFTYGYTPFTAYGYADAPASISTDGKKLTSLERSLSTKFSGSAMITEPLVSVGGVLNTGKTLTMTVDGTPTINAATAAGLLFKVNIETAHCQGLGVDFAITVGGNVYRFFNNSAANNYDGVNGQIYMYNNVNDYAENCWTSTHGDSKIRIPTSFDGYILVPFALLRNGAEALDMNTLATAGITDVSIVGYWADSVMTVESVEVASVPATLANSSVTIGNDITLNASAIVSGTPTSVKANFIMGENTVTVDGVAGENGVYTFALPGIGAHLMMDAIDIELVVDDAIVSRVDDYTIAEYVAKVLRSSEETKVKKVAADLLYYGDAVQNFLGYNTANLATSVLTTEELDNRSNNMINKIKDEVEIAGAISDNVQWKGATVLPVDGGLSIVFKAVVIDATDVAIAVKKGDATETFTADKWGVADNEYIVVFNNIAITELATELTATFVKGTATEGATLTASTNAILAAIADKNSGASQIEKEYVICLYALSNSLANFAK